MLLLSKIAHRYVIRNYRLIVIEIVKFKGMIIYYYAFFVIAYLAKKAKKYIKYIKKQILICYVYFFYKIYELNSFKNTCRFNTFIKKFHYL
ncbi:hypothetical protein SAMN06265346_11397 [Flavobacterium hercynium]|uniref:Uncharacterized protein n=1 Tax=Flavobacterium hercynium TaxID=387094 RepID=A0A226H242_9FLAO|nr:hypothetical protein B0A66_15575 [Flavobacterium hercynium]SMP30639.1 hypothetical protein SAMN06265346_11397 [Flavobacterium hercynium]